MGQQPTPLAFGHHFRFPDLVHSVKPEPHNEMPQASAAHDNFWDFISLMPESMHMIMWVLLDRALPRSYRMMEGFGVHTFRWVNEQGKARFVKLRWKPVLGMHALVWDEVQKLAGKDPDCNRRDLWEAIEMGDYPEFELGVQMVEEGDEHRFDFDLLDPTKLIPEEMVPVRPVGKMVLNRNPDNFFAETEQVAFHPGHVVPGIDFTNDPLLQGRLFSYTDTQLIRLGGPNFAEIPINRPVNATHNNQRDGYMRQTIDKGAVNYSPNSRGGGCPMANPDNLRAYTHYAEKVEGHKIRKRSDSFQDHYSQATLFWNSMSEAEREHIVSAAHFELAKVNDKAIRQRMVDHFNHVDHDFAKQVAKGIGVPEPTEPAMQNHGQSSAALSMENTVKDTVKSRQVAILAGDGFNYGQVMEMKQALQDAGAKAMLVSKFGGTVRSIEGQDMEVDKTFLTSASVMFDAVYVPGGAPSVEALAQQGDAFHFLNEAFRHGKAIAATGEGVDLLKASDIVEADLADQDGHIAADNGVVTTRYGSIQDVGQQFIRAIAQHRHWNRSQKERVPA